MVWRGPALGRSRRPEDITYVSPRRCNPFSAFFHPIAVVTKVYPCACEELVCYSKNSLFRKIPHMFLNFQQGYKQHLRWCALVVLVAVCSLTVSLATRYTSTDSASGQFLSVHKQRSPASMRQRLIKTAAAWHPPVIHTAPLDPVTFYPRIAPAGPPIQSALFGKTLYNRPPPIALFRA